MSTFYTCSPLLPSSLLLCSHDPLLRGMPISPEDRSQLIHALPVAACSALEVSPSTALSSRARGSLVQLHICLLKRCDTFSKPVTQSLLR